MSSLRKCGCFYCWLSHSLLCLSHFGNYFYLLTLKYSCPKIGGHYTSTAIPATFYWKFFRFIERSQINFFANNIFQFSFFYEWISTKLMNINSLHIFNLKKMHLRFFQSPSEEVCLSKIGYLDWNNWDSGFNSQKNSKKSITTLAFPPTPIASQF